MERWRARSDMPIHDWSRVDAGIFHDLHLTWIGHLKTRMNAGLLPSPYYALAEPALGDIVPDVLTLRGHEELARQEEDSPETERDEGQAQPVAGAPSAVLVQELAPPEVYAALARRIVIKDEMQGDKVVAVVELVSRGNKSSERDRDRFFEKTLSLLDARVHLLLIDLHAPTRLVPEGFHALVSRAYGEAPLERPAGRPLEAVSYRVRESGAIRSHAAPLACGDPLPEMPVFLRSRKFVRLPLEQTYTEAFRSLPERFRRMLEAKA